MSRSGKPDGAQGAPSPAKWRILCIDDNTELLLLLKTALGMRHEVVTAESGMEALRIIGLTEPDFIICDVRMPAMDGFETVSTIRQHPDYAHIPVFFLSAEKGTDAARRGFAVGCNLYLTKPFEPMRLLENIDYFTEKCGQTIRPKSHTLEELGLILESARRAPAAPQWPPAAEPVAAQPPPETRPPSPRPQPTVAGTARAPSAAPARPAVSDNERIKAEQRALLADRKRREQEAWAKRFAEIQSFIDRHMKAK